MHVYMFKAPNAPIILFVYRKSRAAYELTVLNLETDTFTRGQWLANKQLYAQGCSISPCGKYFFWIYNQYQKPEKRTTAGISYIPYFTALLVGFDGVGRWNTCRFDKKTFRPIDDNFSLQATGKTEIPYNLQPMNKKECTGYAPTGFLSDRKCVFNGSLFKVEGLKITKNRQPIYDFEDHEFQQLPFPGVVSQ